MPASKSAQAHTNFSATKARMRKDVCFTNQSSVPSARHPLSLAHWLKTFSNSKNGHLTAVVEIVSHQPFESVDLPFKFNLTECDQTIIDKLREYVRYINRLIEMIHPPSFESTMIPRRISNLQFQRSLFPSDSRFVFDSLSCHG
jgi:hypothetical protein